MSALSDNNIVLVTNRTEQDVAYVKELLVKLASGIATPDEISEWNSCTLKGAYNYTDMNRVIIAVGVIADALKKAGYTPDIQPIEIKHNGVVSNQYIEGDIPDVEYPDETFQNVLRPMIHNLKEIRQALGVPDEWMPKAPNSYVNLDYKKANDIERILAIVDDILDKIQSAVFYCNEVLCGEV